MPPDLPVPVPASAPPSPDAALTDEHIWHWLARISQRSLDTGDTYRDGFQRAQPYIVAAGGFLSLSPTSALAIMRHLSAAYSPATVRVTYYALLSFYQHLVHTGLCAANPWHEVNPPTPKDVVAERILEEDQVQALFAQMTPGRPRTFARTLYYLGCRTSEALGITWRDLHLTAQGTSVTLFGKGQKTRVVPVPHHLLSAWYHLPGDRAETTRLFPWTRQEAWRIIQVGAKRAGLPHVSPHWLRHAHATHALARQVPIHVVQRQLGHARLDTTAHYLHVRPGEGSGDSLPQF